MSCSALVSTLINGENALGTARFVLDPAMERFL